MIRIVLRGGQYSKRNPHPHAIQRGTRVECMLSGRCERENQNRLTLQTHPNAQRNAAEKYDFKVGK